MAPPLYRAIHTQCQVEVHDPPPPNVLANPNYQTSGQVESFPMPPSTLAASEVAQIIQKEDIIPDIPEDSDSSENLSSPPEPKSVDSSPAELHVPLSESDETKAPPLTRLRHINEGGILNAPIELPLRLFEVVKTQDRELEREDVSAGEEKGETAKPTKPGKSAKIIITKIVKKGSKAKNSNKAKPKEPSETQNICHKNACHAK